MSSLTLWWKILVCERNFVFESYGFGEIFERQPNAFFLPRPEVGSGWERRPGLLAACNLLTDPSHIFNILSHSQQWPSYSYFSCSGLIFKDNRATGFGVNWDSRGLDLVTWLRLVSPNIASRSFSILLPCPPDIWPWHRYLGQLIEAWQALHGLSLHLLAACPTLWPVAAIFGRPGLDEARPGADTHLVCGCWAALWPPSLLEIWEWSSVMIAVTDA